MDLEQKRVALMYIVAFSDSSVHGSPTKLLDSLNFMVCNNNIVLLNSSY